MLSTAPHRTPPHPNASHRTPPHPTAPQRIFKAYAEIASKPRVQAYIEKCQKLADESVPEQVCC